MLSLQGNAYLRAQNNNIIKYMFIFNDLLTNVYKRTPIAE
ncbi:hypothetical protein P20311_1839 [Pseudoalteromonas sp. BSi20311]|nr:hypothetical protein P20311_1839 [Pseudoalteromonas sp. BSi20311]GAA72192.1 hypothetical protein P20439_2278 [Pseudoalteromonas sp. BSi20439]